MDSSNVRSEKSIINNGNISFGNDGDNPTAELKVVVSRILSSANDLEDVSADNVVEVYSYKTKNKSAAIAGTEFEEGTPRRMGISTGTTENQDLNSVNYVYPASFEGQDYASSADGNTIAVIPPTGDQIDMQKLLIILSMSVIGMVSVTFVVKYIK